MLTCVVPGDDSIQDIDILISSAGGSISEEWAPRFVEAGAVVIDNTSFWRMHEDVPLVVPEVNPEAAEHHKGIIANPNCTTAVMMVAMAPIHRAAGLERLIVSTYQAVSGTGQKAIEELKSQSAQILAREKVSAGRRSIRTGSASTCCPRSKPSRTATTTPPKNAR